MATPPVTTPTTVRIPSIFQTTPTTAYKPPHVPRFLHTAAQHPGSLIAGVIVGVVVLLIWREHHRRRADQVDRVLATMAAVLHTTSVSKRAGWGHPAVRWNHGRIVRVGAGYPKTVVAHPKARAEMVVALSDLLGVPVVCEWDIKHGTLVAKVEPPEDDDEDPGTMGQLRAIFAHALDDVRVTATDHSDGVVTRFTVTYGPTHVDVDEAWRVKMDGIVCSKTGRAWVSHWSPSEHRVVYRTRPELPVRVDRPAGVVHDRMRLPIGVSDGGEVCWDLTQSAHLFVVGSTRFGKSVACRGLAYEAVRRGVEVRVVDPKISLLDLENYPGVTGFACQDLDAMLALVDGVIADIRDRYAQVKARAVRKEELAPCVVLIDEAWDLLDQARAVKHPLVEHFTTLGILAGEANIHLLLASQRCDAKQFTGAFREQFAVLAIGHLKRGLRGMIEAEGLVKTATKGRAEMVAASGSRLVQVYFTPDPLPAISSMSDSTSGPVSIPMSDSTSGPVSKPGLLPQLSDEIIRRIGELADEGKSERIIASTLGVSAGVVNKYKRLHRAEKNRPGLRLVKDAETS